MSVDISKGTVHIDACQYDAGLPPASPDRPCYDEGMDNDGAPSIERARLALAEELEPSERILWAGRPSQSRYLAGAARVYFIAELVVFPLLLVVYFAAYGTKGTSLAVGLLLLAALLLNTFGTLAMRIRQMDRTVYALTDRRAIAATLRTDGRLGNRIATAYGDVKDEEAYPGTDGIGNVAFGLPPLAVNHWRKEGLLTFQARIDIRSQFRLPFVCFFDVEECEKVLALARRAMKEAAGREGTP